MARDGVASLVGLRRALVVAGVTLGVGVALVLVAVAAVALFGTSSPSGGQEVSGELGGVIALTLLAGVGLSFLAVPIGVAVLVVTLLAHGAKAVPPPATMPLASMGSPPDPGGYALPPPDPADRVAEPSLLDDVIATTEANMNARSRPPMAVRLVVSTLIAGFVAVICWTQFVQPMVGRGLFLDGVPTTARVVSVTRIGAGENCQLVIEYEAGSEIHREYAPMSDSGSCAVAVGSAEEIVYSASDPQSWRYAVLLPFPFAVVLGFAGVVCFFWAAAFFGRGRRRQYALPMRFSR